MDFVLIEKEKAEKIDRCWNATGGSSAGEPGASAAGQAGSESKLRFEGSTK